MRPLVVIALGSVLFAGCSGAPAATTTQPTTETPRATPAATVPATATAKAALEAWDEDLAFLDDAVRTYHPDPFAINPESAWTARLDELRPAMTSRSTWIAAGHATECAPPARAGRAG